MQKNQNALFIGYANLEDLATVISMQLAGSPVFGMVSAVSQIQFPITHLTASVQVVDSLNRVHYWRMDLGEHFTDPFTHEEKAVSENATLAWAVIIAYLGAQGIKPTLGQVAAPKDLALLSGHFAGLVYSKAERWHVPAAPTGAGNASE